MKKTRKKRLPPKECQLLLKLHLRMMIKLREPDNVGRSVLPDEDPALKGKAAQKAVEALLSYGLMRRVDDVGKNLSGYMLTEQGYHACLNNFSV